MTHIKMVAGSVCQPGSFCTGGVADMMQCEAMLGKACLLGTEIASGKSCLSGTYCIGGTAQPLPCTGTQSTLLETTPFSTQCSDYRIQKKNQVQFPSN